MIRNIKIISDDETNKMIHTDTVAEVGILTLTILNMEHIVCLSAKYLNVWNIFNVIIELFA